MIKIFIFVCIISASFSRCASAYYEFDKKLEQAYNLILTLHFSEAEKILQQEKIEKPGNDLRLLYLNYIDFLKAFISEERTEFEKLKLNSALRLSQMEKDKENLSSPFHQYIEAEILIQQALVRIKFGENVHSANEIRKAYKLIQKNELLFPSFVLNNKISGILNAIVGSIPEKYQWLIKYAGMEGSISLGINELQQLYTEVDETPFQCYRHEVLFYLGFIYSVFSPVNDSIPLINQMKPLVGNSPLLAYVYSNLMMKRGRNDEAINALNLSLQKKSAYPFMFLYYKRGLARLRKTDLTSETDFNYFLSHTKGENNIKATYQKLAWIDLLKGDTIGYSNNMRLCREKGHSLLDEDKSAQDESVNNQITNKFLLKSRLLFDGGYYREALSEITVKKIDDFPLFSDKLEITYRLGRIMQMTGSIDKALAYYETTIKNGSSTRFHFSANSALMIGLIYEEKKLYEKAKMYFQKCLSLEYDQYRNSIEQKAKAALDRIKIDVN